MAKILVVEDEPVLGLELHDDLRSLNHEVCEVLPDADRVTAVVAIHHPDLVIMDIKLYGFRDGIDAVKQMRLFYQMPVIFLSTYRYEEVRPRIEKIPHVWYLEKPYDLVALQKTIIKVRGEGSE